MADVKVIKYTLYGETCFEAAIKLYVRDGYEVISAGVNGTQRDGMLWAILINKGNGPPQKPTPSPPSKKRREK
jgi:hypothetical protein